MVFGGLGNVVIVRQLDRLCTLHKQRNTSLADVPQQCRRLLRLEQRIPRLLIGGVDQSFV